MYFNLNDRCHLIGDTTLTLCHMSVWLYAGHNNLFRIISFQNVFKKCWLFCRFVRYFHSSILCHQIILTYYPLIGILFRISEFQSLIVLLSKMVALSGHLQRTFLHIYIYLLHGYIK